MFVELHCGACESSFHVESEEEDPVWLMIHRFSNAHADCGFMTPPSDDKDMPLKRKIIKPRLAEDSEET